MPPAPRGHCRAAGALQYRGWIWLDVLWVPENLKGVQGCSFVRRSSFGMRLASMRRRCISCTVAPVISNENLAAVERCKAAAAKLEEAAVKEEAQ